MIIEHRNLSLLKTIEILIKELCHFLDGWGDSIDITVENIGDKMRIKISPKKDTANG